MNNDQISMLLAYMIQSQSSGGFVQNFLFPFLLSAISTIIGAYAAYYLLKRSELIEEERRKLDVLNKLGVLTLDAFYQMITIKQNYFSNLDNDPASRAISTPTLLGGFQNFELPVDTLTLIASSRKTILELKWLEPSQYILLVKNYRETLDYWNKRNGIDVECRSLIMKEKASSYLSPRDLVSSISEAQYALWIDFTERSLMLTDDMLIQLNSPLSELPKVGGHLLSPNILKKYKVLGLDIGEHNKKLLERVPEANYRSVRKLFEMNEGELKNRYRPSIYDEKNTVA